MEVVPACTDDELVAEVLREQAIERGEIVPEKEEEEPEIGVKEILASIVKL